MNPQRRAHASSRSRPGPGAARCLVNLSLILAILAAACGRAGADDVAAGACLADTTLAARLTFADAVRGAAVLGEADDWARQLSAFDRGARQRTLGPTDLDGFLEFVSGAALDWAPEERAYWQGLIDRLAAAMAGLAIDLPPGFMIRTTGDEEFNAAYVRHGSVVLPRERVEMPRDERRDFFLLAHEVSHVVSGANPGLRSALYALLGFERFEGFRHPTELEDRRLSNPFAGHGYEHALRVRTPAGEAHVVPVLQVALPLEDVIRLPARGPPAIFRALQVVLLPVDLRSGAVRRDEDGAPIRHRVEDTDWAERMQRNSSYSIHPEELIADNFALLMDWRSTGVPPTEVPGGPGAGTAVTDPELLRAMEEVLTRGCGYRGST